MGGITTTLFQRPRDPQYNLTTLLLPGNGTNGAQNNTFLDSSSNNFPITRNPSTGPNAPTQGTFSPFSQTGWGNYFNGSTDYLSIADNAALELGSGSFTVEAWVWTSSTATQTVITKRNGIAAFNFVLYLSGGTAVQLYCSSNGSSFDMFSGASVGTITLNTWNHITIQRSGNNWYGSVNGTVTSLGTNSSTVFNNANPWLIGADAGANYVTGYISNVRIVTGSAVYGASNFTVPTAPLTAISGTQLLTCQSNRFIDNSSNAFAITTVGSPSVQAFSPFAPSGAYTTTAVGGSGYFDGTGDFLSFTPTNFNLGTDAFTVEGWVYLRAYSFGSVISSFSSASGVGFSLSINNSGIPEFLIGNGSGVGAVTTVSGTTALPLNAWVYLAATKTAGSGGTMTLYVNGSSVGTPTTTTRSLDQNLGVVARYYTNLAGNELNGYIASARVSNTVRTITVPTEPYTSDANTLVLFNFTNAGITDATAKNDLETVGNAQISTTQSKFGGSSMSFDGTGDWLTTQITPQTSLGPTYTIEAWVYLANTTGTKAIYSHSVANVGTYGYFLFYVSGSSLGFYVRPSTGAAEAGLIAGTISATTWTHVAVSVDNNSARLFINGAQVGSTTSVSATTYTPIYSTVGADIVQGYAFNGYIDDLRITKGFARYTANFNVPTVAFPTQ